MLSITDLSTIRTMQNTKSSVVKVKKDKKITESDSAKNLDKKEKRRDSHREYVPSRLSGNLIGLG